MRLVPVQKSDIGQGSAVKRAAVVCLKYTRSSGDQLCDRHTLCCCVYVGGIPRSYWAVTKVASNVVRRYNSIYTVIPRIRLRCYVVPFLSMYVIPFIRVRCSVSVNVRYSVYTCTLFRFR